MADKSEIDLDNLDDLMGASGDGAPSASIDEIAPLPATGDMNAELAVGDSVGLASSEMTEQVPDIAALAPDLDSNDAGGASVDTAPVKGGNVVNIKNIQSIKVRVQAILGGVNMSVSELAGLKQNDLIPLDACIGDEVDLWANGVLIGKGEIVVIESETPRFGITLTKLVNEETANAAE